MAAALLRSQRTRPYLAYSPKCLEEVFSPNRKLLRFDSIIVNVGAGPFEAHGSRPDTNTAEMTVAQRIFDDAGGYRDVATPAKMYYSGDGHDHWHVRDVEQYELIRLDNGVKVGTRDKHGFCFFDNYLFGSTQAAFYKGCGRNPDALSQKMGLSRGWCDIYGAGTVGRLAVAGEVPKLPDLLWRHEDRAHQPVLDEPADPLSVFDVGLPAGDVLEVPSVKKPALEVVLQQIVDGLPVDPGGFHAYQPHLK
jgi:hypothetical protein